MEDMEAYLIVNKEEIDVIKLKMELGLLEKYYKVKKYCFVSEIDEYGFNFNWRITNTRLISWEEYDRIVQETSNRKN